MGVKRESQRAQEFSALSQCGLGQGLLKIFWTFKDIFTEAWRNAKQARSSLSDKLKSCGATIQTWNENKFERVHNRINSLKKKIENLRENVRTDEVKEKENKLYVELDEWLAREELICKQRSKMNWLKEEDKNTTFFKIKATQRKDKKPVKSIRKEEGSVVTERDEIMREFTNHYKLLFQDQSTGEDINLEQEFADISLRAPDDMNARMREPYTTEEIMRALFEMYPAKAPGINGFSTLFY